MWTLKDAKNRFSAVVDAALAWTPQEVSRRGKPAVVVLSAAEYSRLLDAARKDHGSFADHLMAFPGEDIPRAGKPLVKSKIEAASPKRTGFLKDQVDCPDDFITMGEDEIIALLRDGEGGGS